MNAKRTAVAVALSLLTIPSTIVAQGPVVGGRPQPDARVDAAVPVATLAKSVSIPYEMFTLPNGLRVVVHTNRSVKTVYVQVDYAVGSTAEPAGKTGFAHLFEHLMFNGSENAPDDYSVPMQKLGATINGVTQYDRTAYANMVPTPGLEQVLFLESDRMGYLLGAINQAELDEQRGVVQNEKRMQLAAPLSSVRNRLAAKLYPAGHPYAHGIMGSMADLDAADLDDVRAWFRAHYGPNNAVLSLIGDIDVATARRLVAKYFGDIPAGPQGARRPALVPTLPTRLDETMTDRTAVPYLYRAWTVPGLTDPDAAALQVAAGTLGAESPTSLRQILVERDKMFGSLSIALEAYDTGGLFFIHGPVVAGVDPAVAGRALDDAIATAIRTAPPPTAIARYLTRYVTDRISALASGNGNVGPVVDGLRIGQGPEWYKTALQSMVAQTPDSIRVAATRWLGRPPYALTVMPGAPPIPETVIPRPARAAADSVGPPVVKGTRGSLPPEGTFVDLVFPKAAHARLSNGIDIVYLARPGAALTDVKIDFDAGAVADPIRAPGTQALLLALLDKGTVSRDAATIMRQREQMGADIAFDVDPDRTMASLSVPTANLQPGLNLVADMLRNPAFAPVQVATQRADLIAGLDAERAAGESLFNQTLALRLDAASPYARRSGSGDAAILAALQPQDLRAFHNAWLRPDKATIYVVSNLPLEHVRAMLERSFGDWRPVGPGGVKDRPTAPRPAAPGIVLIDQPGADQAAIVGGQAITGLLPDALLAATVANGALAGDTSSRLSQDLRETKGWTYSVTGQFETRALGTSYIVSAPVQRDKAGEALALMRDHVARFLTTAPLTKAEFQAAIENRIRSLSVNFAGPQSLMDAIRDNRRLGRPDDDEATLAKRYRALTADQARAAFRATIDPARFVWIVTGDAATVKPQLERLGMPITVVMPSEAVGK